MHLKVHTLRNPEKYQKEYSKFMEEEFYEKPVPDVVYTDYSIADFLIVGYKVYINPDNENREIGIFTTFEALDFITVDYEVEVLRELEEIVQTNNKFFREGR